MSRYAHPFGATYPATLDDLKKCKAGKPYKRAHAKPCVSLEPPYPEIVESWVRNGFKEVK